MKKNEGINVDARIEFYLKDNRWKLFLLSISLTKRALIYFKNAELDVVQAEVAEKLETELATAQQRIKELEAQIENQACVIRDIGTPANERELRMLDELGALRKTVKELEADGRIVDWVEEELNAAVEGEDGTRWTEWLVTAPFPFRGTFRDACLAAMSREPKEGEAK